MATDAHSLTSVEFRPAASDDVDILVPLVNDAYRRTEGHIFPGTRRTERGDLLEQIEHILVAVVDGRPAGCVYFVVEGERAHFGLLAVDVRLHGSGIGSALIAHAESLARVAGCRAIHMEAVKEANLIPFYERRGYRVMRETSGREWNNDADWGAAIEWHMVDMEKPL